MAPVETSHSRLQSRSGNCRKPAVYALFWTKIKVLKPTKFLCSLRLKICSLTLFQLKTVPLYEAKTVSAFDCVFQWFIKLRSRQYLIFREEATSALAGFHDHHVICLIEFSSNTLNLTDARWLLRFFFWRNRFFFLGRTYLDLRWLQHGQLPFSLWWPWWL